MSASYFPDSENFTGSAPADWPEEMIADWCSLHRMIEELSAVQRRLGTPMEAPEDYLRVRSLGASISEALDRLPLMHNGGE